MTSLIRVSQFASAVRVFPQRKAVFRYSLRVQVWRCTRGDPDIAAHRDSRAVSPQRGRVVPGGSPNELVVREAVVGAQPGRRNVNDRRRPTG